jgi:hypothetical protein
MLIIIPRKTTQKYSRRKNKGVQRKQLFISNEGTKEQEGINSKMAGVNYILSSITLNLYEYSNTNKKAEWLQCIKI